MPRRLTPLDVSMLALDTVRTPGHVGMVDIFDPGIEGFDYERLIALIRDRIEFVPHYRQRVRPVPARLAAPVWVDDENFDLTFHVRRSALPRPGTLDQLREFVARVLARRLDPSRPLWEIYLVEGLEEGRFALVSKTHLVLVDGVDGVDLGQVLLDADRRPPVTPTTAWVAGSGRGSALGKCQGSGPGDRESPGRRHQRLGHRHSDRGGGGRDRRRSWRAGRRSTPWQASGGRLASGRRSVRAAPGRPATSAAGPAESHPPGAEPHRQ